MRNSNKSTRGAGGKPAKVSPSYLGISGKFPIRTLLSACLIHLRRALATRFAPDWNGRPFTFRALASSRGLLPPPNSRDLYRLTIKLGMREIDPWNEVIAARLHPSADSAHIKGIPFLLSLL